MLDLSDKLEASVKASAVKAVQAITAALDAFRTEVTEANAEFEMAREVRLANFRGEVKAAEKVTFSSERDPRALELAGE